MSSSQIKHCLLLQQTVPYQDRARSKSHINSIRLYARFLYKSIFWLRRVSINLQKMNCHNRNLRLMIVIQLQLIKKLM